MLLPEVLIFVIKIISLSMLEKCSTYIDGVIFNLENSLDIDKSILS